MFETDKPYLIALHLLVTVLAALLCFSVQGRRNYGLPYPLTPASIGIISIVVGSLAAHLLVGDDYLEYLFLWGLQVSGVLAGLIVAKQLRPGGRPMWILPRRLSMLCWLTLAASVVSALVFFAIQGVPFLGGDVEQGRVDAAVSGTGYLRLMAYMSIPASSLLVALRRRFGWLSAGIAFLIIVGLANRSPLLYLICPIALAAWAYGLYKLTGMRVLAGGIALVLMVAAIGGYRVVSQEAFYDYAEYSEDLAAGNYVGVALTALTHYAGVVPSNAVLTKHLIDSGQMNLKLGETYFTLFISALPGEQLSLDREIKELSGKNFIGGGTPPTLMGEGYANFWYFGTFFSSFLLILALCAVAGRFSTAVKESDGDTKAVAACIYGFFVCWAIMAQVAGLAGASTFPVAAAIFYVFAWRACSRGMGYR